MERCPICRATLNGAETCRRCRRYRAELGAGRITEELRIAAMRRPASGDRETTGRLLRRSLLLHRTPETLSLQRLLGQ